MEKNFVFHYDSIKDDMAMSLVEGYIAEHSTALPDGCEIHIYIVWKCKILRNWKYLISTDIEDGMYYEVTYNGELHEWYLDAYRKVSNEVYR